MEIHQRGMLTRGALGIVMLGFLMIGGTPTARAGDVTVTFDPNPALILTGGNATITVTITKDLSDMESQKHRINARVVDSDPWEDDLLHWFILGKQIPVPGDCEAGEPCTVAAQFTLSCPSNIVTGVDGNSGEKVAELRIEFTINASNYGSGVAKCVPQQCAPRSLGAVSALDDPCDPPNDEAPGSGPGSAPVGGIAQPPDGDVSAVERTAAAQASSPPYGTIAGAAAAGVVAIAACGWYARRRYSVRRR